MKCDANGMTVVDGLLRKHGMIAADEVWVHGMWTVDKWFKCVAAKLVGKKLVRMTHGSLSPVYLTRQGKWKKLLVKPIELFLFSICDRIVATGQWEVEWARKWGIRRKIDVIDLKRFFKLDVEKNCKCRDKDAPLHVLYLGRMHPLKGTQYLSHAVEEINGTAIGHPLIELHIETQVAGANKEAAWDWCDVLCLPTLSENFGLVVAEALERGKQVITTDGAPAWNPDEEEKDSGGGRWKDSLVYLRGYRDGTDETRVKLLREALERRLGK